MVAGGGRSPKDAGKDEVGLETSRNLGRVVVEPLNQSKNNEQEWIKMVYLGVCSKSIGVPL